MKKVYIIAVFVALLAGVATYFFASQIEQKTTIKDEPTKDVVVAIEAIPENTVITAEMLRVVQYPTRFINSDAAGSLQEVVGRLARQSIMKDEQVLKSKIVTIGTDQADTALSYQLRPGEYAYTIAADTVQGVAGFISKNDLVDVVYTENIEGENATTILLSDIRVLRLSNYAANYAAQQSGGLPITSYTEITLLLNKEQVITLTQAQNNGLIRLVLKPLVTEDELVEVPEEDTTTPTGNQEETSSVAEDTTAA